MQQEKKLIEYVCGFYFDHKFKQVVLIWKNKPDWQKGKLNGIGGKIEKGELPITAMRREFYEETGILHNEWVDLITLTGEEWRVYFFCSIGKVNEFEYAETKEEEEVAKIEIERLLAWDFDHIPNLDWLIPMAMNKLQFPEEKMSFPESPSKEGNKQIDRDWITGALVQFALRYHISENKDISNDACEYLNDKLKDAGIEYVLSEGEKEGNKEREIDAVEFVNWLHLNAVKVSWDTGKSTNHWVYKEKAYTTKELYNEWNNQQNRNNEKR